MARRNRKQPQETDSALEDLRLQFTDLNQDEFIYQCGFARATYQRLIKLPPSDIKLSPEQTVAICRVCRIPLKVFFERLDIDLTGVPDNTVKLAC